jgi:A/G-specific adenine glycosylase
LLRGSKGDPSIQEFQEALLNWWESKKRDFLWRREISPYKAILAEVLLRKTTAKQSQAVFPTLIERWSDPCALGQAEVDELKAVLRPLGMHLERARLLKALGKELCARFGREIQAEALNRESLAGLPGIGQYASNMVLAVCKGEALAGLDRNFIRILERVFGKKSRHKRPHLDSGLWEFAQTLIPPNRSRDFNWAVMDFGALVCRPRPNCSECPLSRFCRWKQESESQGLLAPTTSGSARAASSRRLRETCT